MRIRSGSYAEPSPGVLVKPLEKSKRKPSSLYSFSQKAQMLSKRICVSLLSWLKSAPHEYFVLGETILNQGLSAAGCALVFPGGSAYSLTKEQVPYA